MNSTTKRRWVYQHRSTEVGCPKQTWGYVTPWRSHSYLIQ